MPDTTDDSTARGRTHGQVPPGSRAVRTLADDYVGARADIDPNGGTARGLRPGEDRLPDLSPAGYEALDDLARSTLAKLTSAEASADTAPDTSGNGNGSSGDERRCARLLRE